MNFGYLGIFNVLGVEQKHLIKNVLNVFLFICIKIVKIVFNRSCNTSNKNFSFQRLKK